MQIFDSHTHNILWNKTSKQQLAKKTLKLIIIIVKIIDP